MQWTDSSSIVFRTVSASPCNIFICVGAFTYSVSHFGCGRTLYSACLEVVRGVKEQAHESRSPSAFISRLAITYEGVRLRVSFNFLQCAGVFFGQFINFSGLFDVADFCRVVFPAQSLGQPRIGLLSFYLSRFPERV